MGKGKKKGEKTGLRFMVSRKGGEYQMVYEQETKKRKRNGLTPKTGKRKKRGGLMCNSFEEQRSPP